MIGALVGAGVSALTSLIGGIRANKQAKKAEKIIEQQRDDNRRWYQENYNKNYLDTAEAAGVLSQIREQNKHENEAVANNAVRKGVSDEARVAMGAATNSNYAAAASQLAGMGTRYKQGIENQYRQTEASLQNQLANIKMQKASAASSFGDAASSAASGIIGAFTGGGLGKAAKAGINAASGAVASGINSFENNLNPLQEVVNQNTARKNSQIFGVKPF